MSRNHTLGILEPIAWVVFDGLYASVSEFIAYRVAIDLALYIHEMEAQKLPEYSQQTVLT